MSSAAAACPPAFSPFVRVAARKPRRANAARPSPLTASHAFCARGVSIAGQFRNSDLTGEHISASPTPSPLLLPTPMPCHHFWGAFYGYGTCDPLTGMLSWQTYADALCRTPIWNSIGWSTPLTCAATAGSNAATGAPQAGDRLAALAHRLT